MINIAWTGNDKGIIAVILGYPILIVANGIIWLIMKIIKRPERIVYKKSFIILVLFYIPAILISGLY